MPFLILTLLTFLNIENLHARPEYAVKNKMRCTACHISPTGGGMRNIAGKVYGGHGLGTAKTSTQENFYGDFRAIYFLPDRPAKNTNGLALMNAALGLKTEVINNDSYRLEAVVSYDFGRLGESQFGNSRETYLRWKNHKVEDFKPTHFLFGIFNLPFGLQSDEHRTYTKIQTNTSVRDMQMGGQISGDIGELSHYDFAITEGWPGGASAGRFNQGDERFAFTGNLRFSPESINAFFGLSAIYQTSQQDKPKPWASSYYVVYVKNRLSWLNEVVIADEFNRMTYNNFIAAYFYGSNAAYQTATANSRSFGLWSELKYELSSRWILIYKYDHFLPSMDYEGDRFVRHGLGARYRFDSNQNIILKIEKAEVGRPGLEMTSMIAALNNIFAVYRLWF